MCKKKNYRDPMHCFTNCIPVQEPSLLLDMLTSDLKWLTLEIMEYMYILPYYNTCRYDFKQWEENYGKHVYLPYYNICK